MESGVGFKGPVNDTELDAGHKHESYQHPESSNTGERKTPQIEMSPYLPLEIRSMIISNALNVKPLCALDALVPEWNTCRRKNPILEKILEVTRIVTYTRKSEGKKSTLSCNFGHDEQDHILLPMKRFDSRLAMLDSWCFYEVSKDYYRGTTHIFRFNVHDLLESISGTPLSIPGVSLHSKDIQDILPFDGEMNETKRMCPWMNAPIFTQIRHLVIHTPLLSRDFYNKNLAVFRNNDVSGAFTAQLVYVMFSPLKLSWSRMPQLESVLLDLRAYSIWYGLPLVCLGDAYIIERAAEMGRYLNLKLLVIAGLQSGPAATSYESVTANQIKEEDEIGGEDNWIKIFEPCLRPGGRLILVDRLISDEQPSLPFWSPHSNDDADSNSDESDDMDMWI